MTGQLCGRCGNALLPEGCPCGWSGSNEETAVIPVIGGPELVRPYFQPDDEPDQVYEAEIVDAELLDPPTQPLAAAGRSAGAPRTQVLPAYLPAQRSAEPIGGVVVTRPPEEPRPGRGRRARRSTRSTLLIGAGIAVIAGVGVAAALVPQLLGSGPVKVALPQPGVTAPLPTQTGPSTTPSAVASAPATHAAPVAQHSPAPTTSAPSVPVQVSTPPSPTRSASAPPSSPPPSPSLTPSPSATGGDDSGTLSLGSSGPAVVTLQQDLASLWDQYLPISGVYNRRTEVDVEEFQVSVGLEPTGVYGPSTQAAMAQALSQNDGQ